MRLIIASVVGLLLCVSMLCADLQELTMFAGSEKVAPKGTRTYAGLCKPNELTRIVVAGAGKSALGLYVYDAEGNCVAWDDMARWNDPAQPHFCDELGLEWIAGADGRHTIEVRSGGLRESEYAMVIR